MKQDEFNILKKLVLEEKAKRDEIIRLSKLENVKDFIEIILNNYTSCFSSKYYDILNKVNEYLNDPDVQKYITLTNNEIGKYFSNDIYDIVKDIIKDFKITDSYDIYVCTGCYAKTFATKSTKSEIFPIPFNRCYSCASIFREYINIETNQKVYSEVYNENNEIFSLFEKNHIVLNPYSSNDNNNGIEDVRRDFYNISFNKTQSYAKKYILRKYNKI